MAETMPEVLSTLRRGQKVFSPNGPLAQQTTYLNWCLWSVYSVIHSIAKTLTPNKLDSRTTRPITFMGNARTDTQSVIYFSHYSWKIFSHDKTFSSGKVWIALCWVSSFIINACCVSTFLQSSVSRCWQGGCFLPLRILSSLHKVCRHSPDPYLWYEHFLCLDLLKCSAWIYLLHKFMLLD